MYGYSTKNKEQSNSSKFCVKYNPKFTDMNSHKTNGKISPPPKMPQHNMFGYIQDWNNFCPECNLDKNCENLPCQTHNIKVQNIYDNIETKCNEWIKLACDEALKSVNHGGGPFGAVIVRVDSETNKAIEYWKNHNHVEEWSDPTAHAEVSTIRVACNDLSKKFGHSIFDLGNIIDPKTNKKSYCVIYSSAEPCPMCYSAIKWARIPMLVFGATRFDAAQQGVDFSDAAIYSDLARPYDKRENIKVFQASCSNSLDAFNRWKRMKKTPY